MYIYAIQLYTYANVNYCLIDGEHKYRCLGSLSGMADFFGIY